MKDEYFEIVQALKTWLLERPQLLSLFYHTFRNAMFRRYRLNPSSIRICTYHEVIRFSQSFESLNDLSCLRMGEWLDHLIPRNKKGESKIENYQALCYTCNSQKIDKDNIDFREWSSMYENRDTSIFYRIDNIRLHASLTPNLLF